MIGELKPWPEHPRGKFPPEFNIYSNEWREAVADYNRARADAAIQRLQILIDRLVGLACFKDYEANRYLEETGSYSAFDDPWSVQEARAALKFVGAIPDNCR